VGSRNDDISLKLAKAVDSGFLPDVFDTEVEYLSQKAEILFGVDIAILSEDAALGIATSQNAIGTRLTKVGMVLQRGSAGAFDSDLVESLCVNRDPATGQLAGTFVGYGFSPQRGSIGLAYSNNGVHWRKELNPILSRSNVVGSPDEKSVTGPVWLYDASYEQPYFLFYIGATADGYEGGEKSICLATASSLKGPWTRRGAVIKADSAVSWRSGAVWHPTFQKHKGRWYMFFNANDSGGYEVIGYAVSDSLLGPWIPDDVNSPVMPMGSSAQWNGRKQGDPSIHRVGDNYVMHYFGVDTLQSFGADGIATTTYNEFPLGWKQHPYNPVLTPSAGTYDGKFAHKGIIHVDRGNVYNYYTAVDSANNRGVALAISASAPVNSTYPMYDSFVRADSGTLGTASTGQTWTYSGGTGWALTGNKARWTGTTDGLALADSTISDNFEISFRVLALNGNYPVNVVARRVDGSTYVNLYRGNGRWNINRNGTPVAGPVTPAPVAGDIISILVRGRSYAILVNGIQVESFITQGDNYTTTVQGIGGAANSILEFSDYSVRPL
jgi:hypothetical protein